MPCRDIPRDQWREELESFSRSHEGWMVQVMVAEPDRPPHAEALNVPLQGVIATRGPGSAVSVMVGGRRTPHLTHEVRNAVKIDIEETDTGTTSALHVRAGDGSTTTVTFRSRMPAEEVDGLYPRRLKN